MKTTKVLMDFIKFPVAFLIEFARNIVSMMTGNAYFATPFVTLAQITTAVNDLEVKFKAALNGGKQQKADMRLSVKTLLGLLRKQAAYIDSIAAGSESIILSSGYHTTHQPSPARRTDFNVGNGENSGEITATHKAVNGARSYLWQHVNDSLPAGENGWEYVGFTTRREFAMGGLIQGSKHWFRVAWITKDGLSSWSNPVMVIVI